MPDGLKIVVGSEVQQAIKGLDKVSDGLQIVEIGSKKLGLVMDTLTKKVALFGGGVMKFIPPVISGFNAIPAAVNKTDAAFKKLSSTTSAATQTSINFGRVIQDAPFGFLGIANNLNPLLESFQRLKAQTGSTGGALKALGKDLTGVGGLGLALSVVSTALIVFGDTLFGTAKSFSAVELAAGRFEAALARIGEQAEDLKDKLDFSNKIANLKAQLAGLKGNELKGFDSVVEGVSSFQLLVNAQKNIANLTKTKEAFEGLAKGIISTGDAAKRMGGKEGKLSQILRTFSDPAEIPEGLISKLSTKEQQALSVYRKTLAALKKEQDRALDLQRDLQIIPLEQGVSLIPDDVKKVDIKPKVKMNFRGGVDIEFPPESVHESVFEFGDMFGKELQDYFRDHPFDANIQIAVTKQNQEKLIASIFGITTSEESPFTKIQRSAIFAAQAIQGVLTPAFQELFSAILKGENPIKAFFKSLGQAVAQLIQKLISAAITAAILSAIFPGGLAGVKGFGSIFGKILGLAGGGIVSGPTLALIGEGSGTSRSNPEVVAPLDQLRAMLSDMGGTGRQQVYVTGRLRGNDMVLQNARTSRSQRRTTGR